MSGRPPSAAGIAGARWAASAFVAAAMALGMRGASTGDLLLTDIGNTAADTQVLSVNAGTGARALLSNDSTGSGTGNDGFNYLNSVAVSPTTGTIYVVDAAGDTDTTVKTINPITGDRVILTGAGVGSGTAFANEGASPLGSPEGIAWDPTTGTLLVADPGDGMTTSQLLRGNPANGARSLVSGNVTGTGPAFIAVVAVAVDPSGNIYVANSNGSASTIVKVQASSGNRTVITGNGTGNSGSNISFSTGTGSRARAPSSWSTRGRAPPRRQP